LDTPGHAKHHFCVFDERSKSFFTGDTFGISYREFDTQQGSFIFAPTSPTQFQPSEWHTSIERLLSYQPQQIYLTHYGQVSNISILAELLDDSIDKLALLMEELSDCDTQRSDNLVENIMTYFIQEIKKLGCQLTPQVCRELLLMDVQLNAQGLEIWWDRE
jgi:glyoxylase-like metal-dependent hydrolase (beta-lactamase superfamily II)